MLLNIGGAHSAYFTRNIVVLTDNAGHTGVGERRVKVCLSGALVDAYSDGIRREVARLNKWCSGARGNRAADFDTFEVKAHGRLVRVNAVAALEAALLDLLGQA